MTAGVRVVVEPDGALRITGPARVVSEDGVLLAEGSGLRLCRCAASAADPHCDEAHVRCGFRGGAGAERADLDVAFRSRSGRPEPAVAPGELLVEAREPGPYLVRGAMVVTTEDGRVLGAGARAKLCRCGRSADKPFCDGSHRKR